MPAIYDCWNKIGVQGDGSCAELQQCIHCRNCPVYSAAATQLIDGDPPPGYLAEWTDHFAQKQETTTADTHSVVVFRIGAEWLALPTSIFKEIGELRPIHSLPHRRGGVVLGIANIRGELLVCISLGAVLGVAPLAQIKQDKRNVTQQRLVVLIREGDRLVFPVDEVYGVHRFHPSESTEVPATVAKATAKYAKAVLSWREQSIGLLDEELLFHKLSRSLA